MSRKRLEYQRNSFRAGSRAGTTAEAVRQQAELQDMGTLPWYWTCSGGGGTVVVPISPSAIGRVIGRAVGLAVMARTGDVLPQHYYGVWQWFSLPNAGARFSVVSVSSQLLTCSTVPEMLVSAADTAPVKGVVIAAAVPPHLVQRAAANARPRVRATTRGGVTLHPTKHSLRDYRGT